MSEYIKRVAVHNSLDALYASRRYWEDDDNDIISLPEAHDIVDEIPDADVAPIIHSSWEMVKSGPGCFDYYFECKHCHTNTPDKAYIVSPDYCPHCGATMDAERGD